MSDARRYRGDMDTTHVRNRWSRLAGPAALITVLGACADEDPLDDSSQIAGWANASSAIGAFEVAREPVAFADGSHRYADPACPMTSQDATTTTLVGGCTDSDGRAWTGRATIVRESIGRRVLTLDGFGNDAFLGAVASTGTVTIDQVATDHHRFEISVVTRGGITSMIEYEGTVVGSYATRTTWNGTGTITRNGDYFVGGGIAATTVDQVRDNTACPGEGWSGTTEMASASNVVVITYDGETACDSAHGARWSRNGEDQGVVTGVTCSAGGPSGGVLVIIAAVSILGRRRTRQPPPRRGVVGPCTAT